jgi:hypothetical protein
MSFVPLRRSLTCFSELQPDNGEERIAERYWRLQGPATEFAPRQLAISAPRSLKSEIRRRRERAKTHGPDRT